MSSPQLWTLESLKNSDLSRASVWSIPRFDSFVRDQLSAQPVESLDEVPDDHDTLIVVGGGTLIDEAKLWRKHHRAGLRLIAVPTIWGSGAEVSNVVAVNRDDRKHIEVDDELVPDVRVVWGGFAESLSVRRACDACGDAWSHAIEGFLSPLATDDLRAEIATTIQAMLTLPVGRDEAWFELSADACAGQARSSVGLVHGIAHTLEGPLASGSGFGHARLCAVFLKPVMALNRTFSDKFENSLAQFGVDASSVVQVFDELFDEADYEAALPLLEQRWRDVLRDPCTRTNSTLVRPAHLSFFTERQFA